jgi:hypothetical protein
MINRFRRPNFKLACLWGHRVAWCLSTSWDKVFDAVEHVVARGMKDRTLGQLDAIAVDENPIRQGPQVPDVGLPDRHRPHPLALGRARTNHRVLPGVLHHYGSGSHLQDFLHLLRHVGAVFEGHPGECSDPAHSRPVPHRRQMNKALDEVRAEETHPMNCEGVTRN